MKKAGSRIRGVKTRKQVRKDAGLADKLKWKGYTLGNVGNNMFGNQCQKCFKPFKNNENIAIQKTCGSGFVWNTFCLPCVGELE